MQDFRKLKVWDKAHVTALDIYKMTALFPKEEQYGLTSQMRRASVSVSSNIAEGCGRNGNAEFARFLYIAMGSASELECQILLAHDLGFLNVLDYERLENNVSEVKKMIRALLNKIKTKV